MASPTRQVRGYKKGNELIHGDSGRGTHKVCLDHGKLVPGDPSMVHGDAWRWYFTTTKKGKPPPFKPELDNVAFSEVAGLELREIEAPAAGEHKYTCALILTEGSEEKRIPVEHKGVLLLKKMGNGGEASGAAAATACRAPPCRERKRAAAARSPARGAR